MRNAEALMHLIREHYYATGKMAPSMEEAVLWAVTEIAEAIEVSMARKTWVRNNPSGKPPWNPDKFAEECGDAVMMLMVACDIYGKNPIRAMEAKLERTTPTSGG